VLAIRDRNERLKALKKLYDGFEAVFEPPASALVDDMLTVYPDAKVRNLPHTAGSCSHFAGHPLSAQKSPGLAGLVLRTGH
jgi:hypothetical protein